MEKLSYQHRGRAQRAHDHRRRARNAVATVALVVALWVWFAGHRASQLAKLSCSRDLPASSHPFNLTIVDFNRNAGATPTSAPDDSYYRQRIQLKPLIANTVPRDSFEAWLHEQAHVSFQRVLANIGDANLNSLHHAQHVAQGAVIASPSKKNPDYFYHWIRDGAITVNTVVNNLRDTDNGDVLNATLVGTVLKYLNNSYILQRTDNPSGSLAHNLTGLGEPKWMVDNSVFTDNWGRPQNDGPALRVITTFNFLQMLQHVGVTLSDAIAHCEKATGEALHLVFDNEEALYRGITHLDLQYILQNWDQQTFDLWEEVNSRHFFNVLCHLKATRLGWNYLAKVQPELDDAENPFAKLLEHKFHEMLNFLFVEGGFLNPNKNHIIETPSILGQRSGLDIAALLAATLTHDSHLDSHLDLGVPFDVDDTAILNTLHGLVKQMRILYPVNHQRVNLNMGVALGRYPEDRYDGNGLSEGNPWFLATSAAAEVLYKVINHYYLLEKDLMISMDGWDSEFWSLFFENIDLPPHNQNRWQLVIPFNSPAFTQTMQSLLSFGDSFLDKVREHVSDDGEMSEQFNKYSGFLQGARHLTWSYGAFWNSYRWRTEVLRRMDATTY
ncbi:LAFE_0E11166g1_1 [Lachancea fermentati]|uniref:glucan 1,4-alpha-glucosidase n=1 Tax=Lachancea fermentati TaxID=4955 RepID=A0A1G4MDZ8_LACFM|nr:LAFE_0E11166g1_1 [Lachancea fermentati]